MNPGRGWNPNLEISYHPEYSEYEDEVFGKNEHQDCIFDLFNFQLLSLCQAREIVNVPKLTSFSILGFFQLEVKLGFEFLKVSPNQKY